VSPDAARSSGVAEIELSGSRREPELRDPRLRAWLGGLIAELAPAADSLAVRWTGDRAMRELNRRYRSQDKTTDVLSFPGTESPEGRHLGDLVISVPQASRQAEERGYGLDRELRVLLLHGILHCLGYDHETDGGEMERLERKLRRRWIGPS